ncbi:MAG: 30S ribosomal protein S20 [Patescibacteria group bacterium]
MPILDNAKKALRVSLKKAAANLPVKSRVKTSMDKVRKEPSPEAASAAYSAIDRAAKKKIFHKNKAARLKGQVAKLLGK